MSRKKSIVEIDPRSVRYGATKELFVLNQFRCGYCDGNGFYWGDKDGERRKEVCPVCKGDGELDAVVSVVWKPSNTVLGYEHSTDEADGILPIL